jgi:hypothetical protein
MRNSLTNKTTWRSPVVVAGGMLVLILVVYLLREHWGHVSGTWPYLLLLLCPLMHVFMHRGHGGHKE